LAAIADLEYEKAANVAEKFKIPSFYRDPDDIFSRDDIDAVHINTPTNSHLALTLAALSAGKKPSTKKATTKKPATKKTEAKPSAAKKTATKKTTARKTTRKTAKKKVEPAVEIKSDKES